MERRTFFKIKLESFNLPGSVFSRLIIKELIELFVVFLNGIFSLS